MFPIFCFTTTRNTDFSRRRVFSIENTFWGFFQQILSTDGGCQEIVNQYRMIAEQRELKPISTSTSTSTSAYCQARKKLNIEVLEIFLFRLKTMYQLEIQRYQWPDEEWLWQTEQVFQCQIPQPIKRHGLNQRARKTAAAFRKQGFVRCLI